MGNGDWPRGRGPTGGKGAFRGLWRRGGGLGGAAKKKCLGTFLAPVENPSSCCRIAVCASSELLLACNSCGATGPTSTRSSSARVFPGTLGVETRSSACCLHTVAHFVVSFPSSLEPLASGSAQLANRLALAKLQAHPRRAGGSRDRLSRKPLRCACATAQEKRTTRTTRWEKRPGWSGASRGSLHEVSAASIGISTWYPRLIVL